MASQCKRQQCTIERLGFRQELDSWRHKLIHCVGFESILEGLFGPELVEDLKLFKDFEPVAVSDWSFDENCLFCCLRRDKVKEHVIGLSSEELENTPRPLLVKNLSTISRLEKQAEEFLCAVLSRKDVPNFSDPHIPIVAREILQRMIRQFAAEYTSKTSSPQDSSSDSKACSDQSLPIAPLQARASPSTSPAATLAGPAQNQNPVLSKLLMADQDAPLDLTIKKPLAEPSEQDGVLDLSIKKNRYSSQPVHSSCLSPATSMLKGESTDVRVAKAKDLQSTSTLEQFMAKLCPHHQRQIVDAIGFLQTEVKALASSSTHQASNSTSAIQGTSCSTTKFIPVTPEKSCRELSLSCESTPKLEVQDISHSAPSGLTDERVPENAVSLKTSITARSATELHSPELGSNHTLVTHTSNPVDTDSNHHGNHAPLKMKIMTSNVADGKKLSCVLNASLSTHSDTLEDRQVNTVSSNKTEAHSARLSSSVKRNNQVSHPYQVRHKETLGQAKDTPTKMFSVHMTIPSDSPRTARKTFRAPSDNRTRDSACRVMADPDLGHCDIVFIDKPITECFKEQQRSILPRRNARKSTRGHMYSDEIWELKTVRTLAGRGNCPNPMPELITLLTPKQMLSKPEGVPPVDMPFVGPCRETMNQQMTTEELDESIIPGSGDMVEVAVSEIDVIVETSQTDQFENKGQSPPPSPMSSPTENKQEDPNTVVEQDTNADSGTTAKSEESAAQPSLKEEKCKQPDFQVDLCECTEQTEADTVIEPENITREEAEPQLSSDTLYNNQPLLLQNSAPSPPSSVNQGNREREDEEMHDEEPQKLQVEAQTASNSEIREMLNTTDKPVEKETEIKTSEAVVDGVRSLETDEFGNDSDVSSKTLDALLKELPPWRRKRGSVISPPKLRQTETVIVGYVNGRPISASDRSLRRRSSTSITSPVKNAVNPNQNVPNKTSNLAICSTVENKSLEQPLLETHKPVQLIETAPVIDHLTEPSSDIVSTTTSKILSMTKQIQKQKKVEKDSDNLHVLCDQPVDCPQSTESTRQLRSASQKLAGGLLSLPSVQAVSPKPTATHAVQSTEQHSNLSNLLSPLSDSSPLILPLTTEASEQSQQSITTESTVELNLEKPQLVETISEAKLINEVECRMQAKQKLRSAKVADDSKNDKWEPVGEGSSPLKSQSPVKTEMQAQTPLRNKRFLRKDTETSDVLLPEKPNVAQLEDRLASGNDSSCSMSDKPTRMPLRSESSKSEMFHLSVAHSGQVDSKKVAMRSLRLAAPSTSALTVTGRQTDVASPIRILPERITKAQGKPCPLSVKSVLPQSSVMPVIAPRPEPPKQTANKFFETLTGEESQHLITNLNIKYDKMQKGWVQMDKEGQPGTKYKSKADRQAAIWKSKRRARKPKSSDHQKYSPVQMLFMKGFNLTSICRWFLESTETKSLVIVKKVNTRLPSETQLCFHSSSSASGTSQGVFPSLQAERLKKHLKKFAIASPVKSNPKSQKLIAKALQQEANAAKAKERKEISSTTQTLSKAHSARGCKKIVESQKSSGKSKNPASARILRKYSNIREKLQVHQTSVRLKKVSKALKSNNMKRLHTAKSTAKSSLKAGKSALPVSKKMRGCAAKLERRKAMAGRKNTKRPVVQEKVVKAQSSGRASRNPAKKELPKRWSQRLGSLKISDHTPASTSKSNVDNKKTFETQKSEVTKMNGAKIQTRDSSQSTFAEIKGTENAVDISQQSTDVKVPTSPDQVLTRSQRKMEMAVPLSGSPSHASKRATKTVTAKHVSPKIVRKAEEATLTRSGALKTLKRSQAALLPRSATKLSAKRAQESSESPAKRTRMSFSK